MIPTYDAESAVIGGLLRCPEKCFAAIESLRPEDFENPLAASAFQTISEGRKKGNTIDASLFGSGNINADVKTFAVVATESFLSPSHFEEYVSAVKEGSNRRRLTSELQEITFGGGSYAESVERLSKIVEHASEQTQETDDSDFLTSYILGLDKPENIADRLLHRIAET